MERRDKLLIFTIVTAALRNAGFFRAPLPDHRLVLWAGFAVEPQVMIFQEFVACPEVRDGRRKNRLAGGRISSDSFLRPA
jgi:hypothetical protein